MNPFNENKNQRSPWLLVLCIFTFIGSGGNFLTYFMLTFTSNYLPQLVDMYSQMGMPQEVMDSFEFMLTIKPINFLIIALCYGLAVIGAAFMLKMNKLGFHFYVIAQLALFAMTNLVIKGMMSQGWTSIMLTVMLILLYAMLMKDVLLNQNTDIQDSNQDNNNRNLESEDEDDDV